MALGEHELRIIGADANDQLGDSSVTGDFNDDGRDDILVGAWRADGPDNTRPDAGESYVIYSDPPNWGISDLALATYNLRITGADSSDGLHPLAAGNFNGDGSGDVL